ncbi:hypothetical protein LINPERHAP2_LOCUS35588, partial [Linum perenne]
RRPTRFLSLFYFAQTDHLHFQLSVQGPSFLLAGISYNIAEQQQPSIWTAPSPSWYGIVSSTEKDYR